MDLDNTPYINQGIWRSANRTKFFCNTKQRSGLPTIRTQSNLARDDLAPLRLLLIIGSTASPSTGTRSPSAGNV